MDQLREALFRIERDLGEIKGGFASLLREMARMNGQIELHVSEDTRIHATQDQRLLQQIGNIGERIAVLEQAHAAGEGERGAGRRWADWLRVGLGAAVASLATWLASAGWRH